MKTGRRFAGLLSGAWALVPALSCGAGDHVLGSAVTRGDGGATGGGLADGAAREAGDGRIVCTSDSGCPASARFCLTGSCVQCRTSMDCGSGRTPSCWPSDHTCRGGCTSNQQCPQDSDTPICEVDSGACVGCLTSSDCPTSLPVCEPGSAQCVQCTTNAECSGTSTPVCVNKKCGQCATNADCTGMTPYCSTSSDSPAACVQCLDDSQCQAGTPHCNGGVCAAGG